MNKIYVGNLPYQANEQDIEALFTKFGSISQIDLIKDRETGRSRGFAFVTFNNQAEAQAALEMSGKDYQGKNLTVNMARERKESGGFKERGSRGRRW